MRTGYRAIRYISFVFYRWFDYKQVSDLVFCALECQVILSRVDVIFHIVIIRMCNSLIFHFAQAICVLYLTCYNKLVFLL